MTRGLWGYEKFTVETVTSDVVPEDLSVGTGTASPASWCTTKVCLALAKEDFQRFDRITKYRKITIVQQRFMTCRTWQ